jgi:HAD superfamily hydrolase (TIGR01459 family)
VIDNAPPPVDGLPPRLPRDELTQRYDGMLIDAYGVLVDKQRALPGAPELLEQLDGSGCPWLVVTNSASRLPETLSAEFAALGIEIPAERMLTSGMLLAEHFAAAGLAGAGCVVLGPEESRVYAERAGGHVLSLDEDADAEVLIVADQQGVRMPEDLNLAVSLLLRRLDAGRPMHLLLCNPDLIYPVRPGRYGFTAGGLAAMLEAVLHERWPHRGLGFLRLGKPSQPIFEAACRRLGCARPLMIGDQLGTDIAGALRYGMDALLVGSGLAPRDAPDQWPVRPTWFWPTLEHLQHPASRSGADT